MREKEVCVCVFGGRAGASWSRGGPEVAPRSRLPPLLLPSPSSGLSPPPHNTRLRPRPPQRAHHAQADALGGARDEGDLAGEGHPVGVGCVFLCGGVRPTPTGGASAQPPPLTAHFSASSSLLLSPISLTHSPTMRFAAFALAVLAAATGASAATEKEAYVVPEGPKPVRGERRERMILGACE